MYFYSYLVCCGKLQDKDSGKSLSGNPASKMFNRTVMIKKLTQPSKTKNEVYGFLDKDYYLLFQNTYFSQIFEFYLLNENLSWDTVRNLKLKTYWI